MATPMRMSLTPSWKRLVEVIRLKRATANSGKAKRGAGMTSSETSKDMAKDIQCTWISKNPLVEVIRLKRVVGRPRVDLQVQTLCMVMCTFMGSEAETDRTAIKLETRSSTTTMAQGLKA